ncbi:MAG: class I SAM-dependent methyltransferase [Verrucomicrobia bacterium]|nr:class I SAM-dependent methyltransferase [Verrucomicrobiota bacterium]
MKSECLACGGRLRPSGRYVGLSRCEACSFTTADLALSEEQLRQLYTAHYFAGDEYRDYVADRPVIEKQFRVRLRRLLKFVPAERRRNLFEIGCAHGFFLALAQEAFDAVEGIDISADATEYGREVLGLNTQNAEFLSYPFTSVPDVVSMWDTIEHLSRPDLYIGKIAEALAPGGILALTTADLESWAAKIRGNKWRQIHPPTHLHYFSRRTLHMLLGRFGLEVVYMGTEGMYRSVDTMAYIILCLKSNRHNLYARLKNTGLLNWDLYLNLGDILFVVAKKA